MANLFELVTQKVKVGETRIAVIVMVKSVILKHRYAVSREAPLKRSATWNSNHTAFTPAEITKKRV